MTEQRKNDDAISVLFGKFLDNTFYPETVTDFARVEIQSLQVKGIDTMFNIGEHYDCDEKAVTNNTNLYTGCFELSTLDKELKNRITGWFINDKCINNTYLYSFLDRNKNGVDEVENLLFYKKDVFDYLKSKGLTKELLIEHNNKIVEDKTLVVGKMNINGYKIACNYENNNEEPVNVLIPRDVLRKMSIKRWTDDGKFNEWLKSQDSRTQEIFRDRLKKKKK